MKKIEKESLVLADKILRGFQKAVEKVYENARKNGEELVIADEDGKVIRIKP
ncbi:MAG: hypothetical protein JNL70_19385 [Saprospiraceae bacterium]|nr:hypothetical protein [Saprospiraceae bacterium]